MMKHIAWATVLSLVLLVPVASAQTPVGPVNQAGRQARGAAVKQRLRQGVQQGQITRGELTRIRAELRTVREQARAVRAAGASASPEQRRALRQELQKLNRMIFVMRHNRIRRP